MTQVDKKQIETNLSVVDLFTIGIGPSSSHTVGPMRAGYLFCQDLINQKTIDQVSSLKINLYGSLALTGKGHATDNAVLLGLSGQRPRSVDPDNINVTLDRIRENSELVLGDLHVIKFVERDDLLFNYEIVKPEHPNAMQIAAFNSKGDLLHQQEYFSVGGGFIVCKSEHNQAEYSGPDVTLKYPFTSAEELLEIGKAENLSIAEIMMANEHSWRSDDETYDFLKRVRNAMSDCIDRGCQQTGKLPGAFNVQRRANELYCELTEQPEAGLKDPLTVMDWVNLYALAVSEENAAGGRVVTAPTNGAAGVMPAVLRYYERFAPNASEEGMRCFLLTAAAIGVLYKKRASISGAEVGCQGEVGVACSMAAGGLTAALGGSNEQVENAAEIGMEHNLGLTCDPVGGLVQIPCIERNTMGAMKAINASRLALRGDGTHLVSLDKVIETMRQTGLDMRSKYKETSKGGLAVSIVAC
ncbi:L-serine deaminase I [Candidatus Terasakiella magnetica]|uniref:L-serine dehydratase n=1 Tax=Candidatus Terasakiella magnetica TaxID=1867952 RepID=A0A1C3RC44_9PROT|nr:L-serine ammonia-lyase [Candidatus Terasakiella magnetica]SCA54840.1 L-serine deaminase I [Candidatus Terasakiella magnetica]